MQVIVHAILINILNPKFSIFFFAFLLQRLSSDDSSQVLFGCMSELQRGIHGAFHLRRVRCRIRSVRCRDP